MNNVARFDVEVGLTLKNREDRDDSMLSGTMIESYYEIMVVFMLLRTYL